MKQTHDSYYLDEIKIQDLSIIIQHLICTGIVFTISLNFSTVLLQDFSYASIYLICSIAGKGNLNWVCAGDTAQIISPWMFSTSDISKQTMLTV